MMNRRILLLAPIVLTLALAGCGPIGTPQEPQQWPQITWVGKDERKIETVYTYYVYPSATTWNDIYGNFILAKFVHHQWQAVYIGETASLRTEFRDGSRHILEWPCIEREGATHVHAHTTNADPSARQTEVLNLRREHAPTCNPIY